MKRCENLHVYPAPIVGESRIFRQTAATASSGLFDEVVICGTNQEGLPPTARTEAGVTIRRVGSPRARPGSAVRRILGQLRWSYEVYQEFRHDSLAMVNAHSVAVLPVCAALARAHRAVLVYDTHELETETATARGLQGRVFRFLERRLIRRADVVLTVNQSIAEWYESTYPGVEALSVRNSPPPAASSLDFVDLRASLGIPDSARLYVHVGNLVAGRNIEIILRTFSSSQRDHVVFLGSGELESLVSDASRRSKYVHHVPAIPTEEVVATLASADVGLCLIEPSCLSYRLSLPNKALEYAAAGLPFFFSDLPEVVAMMGGDVVPWMLSSPATELAAAIAKLTDTELERGRATIAHIKPKSWSDEAERMLGAFRVALGRRSEQR